jgi:hypothetical protein
MTLDEEYCAIQLAIGNVPPGRTAEAGDHFQLFATLYCQFHPPVADSVGNEAMRLLIAYTDFRNWCEND